MTLRHKQKTTNRRVMPQLRRTDQQVCTKRGQPEPSNHAVLSGASSFALLEPKIGSPRDKYEVEADRVAEFAGASHSRVPNSIVFQYDPELFIRETIPMSRSAASMNAPPRTATVVS